MPKLQFDEKVCETCPTADCLVKCRFIDVDKDQAKAEMLRIARGEDSIVFDSCVTCYACEEYCKRGNHPFYLITEKREEKGLLTMLEAYPECMKKLQDLAAKYDLAYSGMVRIIDCGHAAMFAFAFAFNRADADMMERTRNAIKEVSDFVLDIGGLHWKPTVNEQKLAIAHMDPNTRKLMEIIKANLDPNGIMNPGNWEVC